MYSTVDTPKAFYPTNFKFDAASPFGEELLHCASSPPPPPPPSQPAMNSQLKAFVLTTLDALIVIQACRQGVIPFHLERLSKGEEVGSGSVYVLDRGISPVQRWTDHKKWTQSRIQGNFLIYRETNEPQNRKPKLAPPLAEHRSSPYPSNHPRLSRIRRRIAGGSYDLNGEEFRGGALMKQTFSLENYSIISYYREEDVFSGRLKTPTELEFFRNIAIPSQMLRADLPKPINDYGSVDNEPTLAELNALQQSLEQLQGQAPNVLEMMDILFPSYFTEDGFFKNFHL